MSPTDTRPSFVDDVVDTVGDGLSRLGVDEVVVENGDRLSDRLVLRCAVPVLATSSFFFVSTLITGCPSATNAAAVSFRYSN
jgi:hypothetical protein